MTDNGAAGADAGRIEALEREVERLSSRLRDLEGGDLEAVTGLRSPYVNLVEALGTGIFLYRGAVILYVNQQTERITGYPREELLALPLFDLIHPDDRILARRYLEARMSGEQVPRYVLRILTKQRETRWISFVGQRVDVDGQPAVLGYGTDVTELEHMQAALRRSEILFRTLAESTSAGIFVHRGTEMVYLNPAAVRMSGYERAELERMGFWATVHPDYRDIVRQRGLARLEGGGPPLPYEIKIVTKDGKERFLEITGAPLVLDGQPSVLGTAVDVTERKRAEQEMLRAQKLESLGILAGGIAHDFNNIMTAIIGNLSLARAQLDRGGSGAAELLARTEKAVLGARHLTQQLLTFSKGGEPVMGPVDLMGVVRETVTFVLSGSRVEVRFQVAPDLPPVRADEGQLGQVVSNLVINAMQAMDGRGRIRIAARERPIRDAEVPLLPAGSYVEFEVADEGAGIAAEHLPLVFDPYFTTKPRGTGLGLSAAHSIVRKHDGHVDIESTVGRGTTVRVLIPASGMRSPHPAPPPDRAEEGQTGRVLVMDDDDAVRAVAVMMLEHTGYAVAEASDGAEALVLYRVARDRGEPFDVVLLDLTVPVGMGGKETVTAMRAIDPAVRAIVSSGYSNDPILAEHERHGFCGVVVKPYSSEDLCAAVRDAIRGGREETSPHT